MSSHLKEYEFEDLLQQGNLNLLDEEKRVHLKRCEYCQGRLHDQQSTGLMLRSFLHPQQAPLSLMEETRLRLNTLSLKPKKDWFLMAAIIIIFAIALSFLIHGPSPLKNFDHSMLNQSTQNITQKVQNLNLTRQWFEIRRETGPLLEDTEALLGTRTVLFLFLALTVAMIYILLDRFLMKYMHS